MKKVSTARAKQLREYAKLKRQFLKTHNYCLGCGGWVTSYNKELHHRFGRIGRLLCWVPGFTCACANCHKLVKDAPWHAPEALKCPHGCWNDYRRAVAWHNQKDTK